MKLNNEHLFQERKAAQAAAFLIFKAGGKLEVLKLMKLMYLAERESLRLFGEVITGDAFVSMPHGPVLSMTLDCINGVSRFETGGWKDWIAARANNVLALKDASMLRSPEQDLLALSDSDLEALNTVWLQYGHYSAWDLRNMTHDSLCPEWEDPQGSSYPIPMEKLLSILGYNQEQVDGIIENISEQAKLTATLKGM